MSYDVSEQPAQDRNAWLSPEPQANPRHRYEAPRRPGDLGGMYPGYQSGEHPAVAVGHPTGGHPAASYSSGGYPGYGADPRREPTPGNYGSGGYPAYPAQPSGVPTEAPPQYGGSPGYGWAAATEQYATESAEVAPPAREQQVTRQHDPAAAELRSQIVRRVRFMNFRHAEHAWERRYRDPIGPHALAFLYSEPARGKPPRYTLRTATRLFLAGPEVDDLPRLLQDLAAVVGAQAAGGFDPRTIADRAEEMSPSSFYVGLAVSSLDTPAGPWAHQRQRLAGSIDVPGRCYALLTDDTMVLMDRGGEQKFGHFEVRATDSLDEIPGDSMQRWTYDRSLRELKDPATSGVWRGMRELHNRIVGRAGDEK
ncbi:MAG TPA: hypothetical protein VFO77_03720 [Actinoplanes sp.]|nr:hypothetical protein [Actinoplanes sp.]